MACKTPILIIERDKGFRSKLFEILEKAGFQNIHQASSLMEATTLVCEGVLFNPDDFAIVESNAFFGGAANSLNEVKSGTEKIDLISPPGPKLSDHCALGNHGSLKFKL